MSKDPVDNNLRQVIRDLTRRISALERQQNDVGQLSELSSDMGLQLAGEFRAGNGVEPGEGFSGVRMTEAGVNGYANDVLQSGMSATDGKITAGAGAVTVDADGLKISLPASYGASSSIEWTSAGVPYSTIYSTDGGTVIQLNLATNPKTGEIGEITLNAVGATGQYGKVVIQATHTGSTETAKIDLDSGTNIIGINADTNNVDTIIYGDTGAVLTVDAGDNDVDIATKLNFGDTGAITGGAETINDDAAFSFTPATARGVLILRSGGANTTVYGMFTFAAVAGTAYCYSWIVGSATVAATGALAGTTGTDGKVTVSAHTDGKIYIENRSGGNLSCAWQIVAGT